MAGALPRVSTGLGALLLLGVLWGATFPIARLGVDGGADPFVLVALDLLLAAVVMAPVAVMTGSALPPLRRLLESAGLGALLIAGINLPLFWGLRYATGGTASIVYATAPIVSLAALWAIGNPVALHRREATALAIGVGGVALLGFASTGTALVAGLAALAAFGVGAVCQGFGAVLVGRARPQGEGRWGLTFQFAGGAAASLMLLPILSSSLAVPLTLPVLGSVFYIGVLSMALGYTLFFGLIQKFGAVRANQVTFLNPVVALALGVVALGESFHPLEVAALACVLVALALLQPRSKVRRSERMSPDRPLVSPGEAT
jgi:drug/metabolite transporter (DMT)-like permease